MNENARVGNEFSPGDNNRCIMVFDSNDSVDTVTNFYAARLNNGDWTVASTDSANGVISFRRKSRPQTVGTVSLLGRGQHSEIDIQLDS